MNYNIIINKLFFLLKNNVRVFHLCVRVSKVAFWRRVSPLRGNEESQTTAPKMHRLEIVASNSTSFKSLLANRHRIKTLLQRCESTINCVLKTKYWCVEFIEDGVKPGCIYFIWAINIYNSTSFHAGWAWVGSRPIQRGDMKADAAHCSDICQDYPHARQGRLSLHTSTTKEHHFSWKFIYVLKWSYFPPSSLIRNISCFCWSVRVT